MILGGSLSKIGVGSSRLPSMLWYSVFHSEQPFLLRFLFELLGLQEDQVRFRRMKLCTRSRSRRSAWQGDLPLHGGWWEAELKMGHKAHADLCTSASTCGSSVKANLVSFCQTAIATMASVEACSENTKQIFCVEMVRFTCCVLCQALLLDCGNCSFILSALTCGSEVLPLYL